MRLAHILLLTLVVIILAGSATAAGNPADGLALYLPLTTDLRDHSANRHPVEVVGNVELRGEGAYFGGRRDWLEAPHIPLNERPFAVALWVRDESEERVVGLVEQFDLDRYNLHFSLFLRENRQPYFGFQHNDLMSPLNIPWEAEWRHLVFQFTGEFQQIWINGRLICSRRTTAYQGTGGVTSIGKVPRWSGLSGKDLVGYLREVRIYQRTLAVEEIAELSDARWLPGGAVQLAASDGNAKSGKPTKQHASLASMLPENAALPFLEIDGKRITVNGRPGQVYELQGTTDFNTWTPLGQSTNEIGRVTYVESEDAPAMQFYRVLVVNAAE